MRAACKKSMESKTRRKSAFILARMTVKIGCEYSSKKNCAASGPRHEEQGLKIRVRVVEHDGPAFTA